MNQLTKSVVDVAFRLRAWDRTQRAALAARRTAPPMPPVVGRFLHGVACNEDLRQSGWVFDGVTEQQKRTIVRVSVALGWFVEAGCPIVSLDEDTAYGFASTPPPHDATEFDWPLKGAYALSIGQGAALVRHSFVPQNMPEDLRADFTIQDGVVPIEAWFVGLDFLEAQIALVNLTENVGAAIAKRPDGLTVTERHPSRKAARKLGGDSSRIPDVEYVIGSDIVLGRARRAVDADPTEAASSRPTRVRTTVTGYWKHQTCGPRRSERRLQWIPSHWRGREDAPLSVHAMRIACEGKRSVGSDQD
jgi:hypothetical protein